VADLTFDCVGAAGEYIGLARFTPKGAALPSRGFLIRSA